MNSLTATDQVALPDTNTLPGSAPTEAAKSREMQEKQAQGKLRFIFVAAMIIGISFLQKFGISIGDDAVVPFIIPMMLIGIGVLAVALRPEINPIRLGLYLLFVILSLISTGFFAPQYSVSSVLLFATLYLPMVFCFEISQAEYRRYLDFFSTIMVVMAGIEFAQHIIQLLFSWQWWPNLNILLPEQILIPFYNYIQPVMWGMPYMKPNAIFFLEVSLLSQFLAIALALEIVFFRRTWRIALFTAGLFATFAGTGLLLMIIALPVLLGRARIRTVVLVLLGIAIVTAIAYWLGWYDLIAKRLTEFEKAGSSGNMRFIVPFERMADWLAQPGSLYSGIGAGQVEKTDNYQYWPIAKAILEYGFLPGIAFYAFFLYSMFERPISKKVAFLLTIWFSIEGALLTSLNPLTCALLCSLFALPRSTKAGQFRPALAPSTAPAGAYDMPASLAATPQQLGHTPSAPTPRKRRTSTQDLDPSALAVATLADGTVDLLACCGQPDTGGRRIYAIGDIHGRADLFAPLINHIVEETHQNPPADGQKPLIVLLGDYIDRGLRSKEVLDLILELKDNPAFEVRCLVGNHEDAMLDFIDKRSVGTTWGRYGGRATLTSYGIASPEITDSREKWNEARDALMQVIPQAHVTLLRSLEESYSTGDLLFVHAGVRPGIPIDEQNKRDLLFIRSEFLQNPVDCGKVVVHGHTPAERAYGAPNRLCLDSGAYASGCLSAVRFSPGENPEILEARLSAVTVIRRIQC